MTQEGAEEIAVGETGEVNPMNYLQDVLKTALVYDGLARGLHEAVRALDRKDAQLCIVAEDLDEANYQKLITALCKEQAVPLVKFPDSKQLGEWSGLCKIDRDGTARKVVSCSCVVVRNFGEQTQALTSFLEFVKQSA
eukprot:TRINITY_DN10827_c0_g1_i3.p1 TRINITY_DN10827_c0_g1~~TRINITY_DN10827_c0_g1_i3.p1  ORF type:complete len:138 (+),score=31.20 TRINITY_DN10827_c0_g1_i3:474-887(+)